MDRPIASPMRPTDKQRGLTWLHAIRDARNDHASVDRFTTARGAIARATEGPK